jgi:excisionase family DNA binding protein
MVNSNDIMTIKEAADAIGIGLATVYRRIDNNKIPTVIVGGKKVILKSVVESLRGDSLDNESTTQAQENVVAVDLKSDKSIDNNKLSDLNNGLNIIQTRINLLKKQNELEELEGSRLKPEQLKKKEEELIQWEQRLTEIEVRNKERQLRLDNGLANLELRLNELKCNVNRLDERELKAVAVENELKKRILEFGDKVKKDTDEIKLKREQLDIKERDTNDSRNCLIEDIAKFNATVDRWRRYYGVR